MKTSGLILAMRRALGLGGAGAPALSLPPEGAAAAVPLGVADVRGASGDASLAGLAATLLARLDQGERFGGAADVAAAETLRERLATAADVHANAFSAQRYRDLLMPVLSQVAPEDLAGATVVDLDCGTVNPFTFSFLLLLLGAERAYAIDAAPVSDLAVATRALATAAGWLLVQPHPGCSNCGRRWPRRRWSPARVRPVASVERRSDRPGAGAPDRQRETLSSPSPARRPTSSSLPHCSSTCPWTMLLTPFAA